MTVFENLNPSFSDLGAFFCPTFCAVAAPELFPLLEVAGAKITPKEQMHIIISLRVCQEEVRLCLQSLIHQKLLGSVHMMHVAKLS